MAGLCLKYLEYDTKNSYLNNCHYNYYVESRTENDTRTKSVLLKKAHKLGPA